MSSIDYSKLFKKYYQNEYDFNTASLNAKDIEDIKRLSREKRVDYAIAPMGTGVFNWILNQNSNIRFEMVAFDSEKIDGMLYIPTTGKECAYIILNANKPLINQVFTAAHEYYHYIRDYQKFKESPYVCDFSALKDVNEMCASRFAAELLLPEEALKREVNDFVRVTGLSNVKELDFNCYATLSIYLTVKYQMPLKAVIYRFAEENFIDNVKEYIENYEFMKKVLQEIQIFKKRVKELYGKENVYVMPYSSTYEDMEKAFLAGNARRENIIEDAQKLGMDMNLICEVIKYEENEENEDDDNDSDLFALINSKRG